MVTFTYDVVLGATYEERLFLKGHLIRRWFDGMKAELHAAIVAEAPHSALPGGTKSYPPRTNKNDGTVPGHLRAGITVETHLVHSHLIEGTIRSDAYYTMYVLSGTGRIYFRGQGGQFGGRGLDLPAQPWIKRKRLQSVSGQEPNDFFLRGYEIVATRHSSLR
jgi:hypothetical protein